MQGHRFPNNLLKNNTLLKNNEFSKVPEVTLIVLGHQDQGSVRRGDPAQ